MERHQLFVFNALLKRLFYAFLLSKLVLGLHSVNDVRGDGGQIPGSSVHILVVHERSLVPGDCLFGSEHGPPSFVLRGPESLEVVVEGVLVVSVHLTSLLNFVPAFFLDLEGNIPLLCKINNWFHQGWFCLAIVVHKRR